MKAAWPLLLAAAPAFAQTPELVWMRGGQTGGSYNANWSPDGTAFAIGGGDGTVKLFDSATNLLTKTIDAHALPVLDVRFRPDGQRLVSFGEDDALRVWTLPEGGLEWEASLGVWVRGVAWSPDGLLVANGRGSEVQVRDASTGAVQTTLAHVGDLSNLTFSPDGARLVASGGSSGQTLRSWRTSDWSFERDYASPHEWANIAFSADSSLVATGGGFDNPSIRIWNPDTGALLDQLPMGSSFGPATGVGFTPDGMSVYAGHRHNGARVFDLATGSLELAVPESQSMRLAPDGATFLGQPPRCGEPGFRWASFDFATGALIEEFMTHTSGVFAVDVHPSGDLIASAAIYFDSAVRTWDTATSDRVHEFFYTCNSNGVSALSFSPDGTRIAAGGGDWGQQTRIWSLSDGTLLHEPLTRCLILKPPVH